MTDLKNVLENGFNFSSRHNDQLDLALISLKVSLKAYFSTYQTMKGKLRFADSCNDEEETNRQMHNANYCEQYVETVVHFQHFAELFFKSILRDEHPLLADKGASNPEVLYDLVKGNNIAPSLQNKIFTVEFAEALRRLVALVNARKIHDYQHYMFVKDFKSDLDQLNMLRNRIWHRGVYILHFKALDILMGKYLIPFALKVLALPTYSGLEGLWRAKDICCAVDVLQEIAAEAASNTPDHQKISLLKELGRASYHSPIRNISAVGQMERLRQLFMERDIERAKRIAKVEAQADCFDVENCPVCGVEALIVVHDVDHHHFNENTGEPEDSYVYTYQVRCECCSFSLENDVKNPSTYGLTAIPDYWKTF